MSNVRPCRDDERAIILAIINAAAAEAYRGVIPVDCWHEPYMASGELDDEIAAGVKKLLNDAIARADESPLPDPSDLMRGVYASPEDLDTPHHK